MTVATPETLSRLRHRARDAIEDATDQLVGLSSQIHEHPEVAFEEFQASATVAQLCAAHGFGGGRGVDDLDTAVRASRGSGALNIAFCAEYDALPGIGHACGHNLIAGASVGAAIGLASVADEIDVTAWLLGTPAEERGGGKIELLKRGAFHGIHAALMVHPVGTEYDIAAPSMMAVAQVDVSYAGRAAHASVTPHLGRNAADAMTVAQVAIGLLRQQLAPGHQVHGITTRGGDAANIIPSNTRGEYFLRASDLESLTELQARIVPCFEAGGLATGCTCAVEPIGDPYAQLVSDPWLVHAYQANAEQLGRRFEPPPSKPAGSTDMGNVSHVIPSIHPTLGLDCLPAMNHQAEFARHTNTRAAHQAMITAAVALAWTAIDAACSEPTRQRLVEASTR